jgi:hypothetical protein
MGALFTGYSLSGAAGIRASWAMLVISCCVGLGYLNPPPSLAWVGSWWMVLLALAASIVDFIGDKVPALDHGLHALHLVLAPVVGGIAAMTGYHGEPVFDAILGVLGGANAFFLHSARSGVRAASTVTTMAMANPLISIVEDCIAAFFIIIAIFAPLLTAGLMILFTIWIIKKAHGMVTSRRATSA